MKQYVHPVLGLFEAESWEWQGRQPISLRFLGCSTPHVSIVVPGNDEYPTDAQFQALVDLVNAPPSYREVFAAAILDGYSDHIRRDYLSILTEIPDVGFTADDLPEIHVADEVWRVIKELSYLWVNEDATVSVSFSSIFDVEHELRVLVKEGAIVRVWTE